MAGVEKVGRSVRRPVGPWTPAVHALLEYVQVRIPGVPRVLGVDEEAEELSFVPGVVHEQLNDAQIASAASWIRMFHDAVFEFEHEGPWRFFGVERPSIIGHNDLRPANMCFDGDAVAGVFDWDLAGPSTPALDLAYFAWSTVLTDPDVDVAALRLEIIAEAYGCLPEWICEAVVPRLDILIAGIPEAVRRGDVNMQRLVDAGEPERVAALRDRFVEDFLSRGDRI